MSCKINIIEKKAKAEYTGLHAYSNRLLKPAYYEVHCWKQQQKAEANQKVKYPLRLPKFCNFIGGFCNFTVPVKNLWLRIPHAFFRDIKSTHTCFQPWIFAQKIKKKFRIACAIQNLNSLLEEEGEYLLWHSLIRYLVLSILTIILSSLISLFFNKTLLA